MIGLFFSQAILFAVVALLGFAIGWRFFAFVAAERDRDEARDVERLRGALSDAQVRRARIT
jgi:membrane protein implicated in regulation of membrane protease activity